MLTIIIPTYNEVHLGILKEALARLAHLQGIEIICVDRKSQDGTQDIIKATTAQFIETDANTRAERMNIGINNAKGDIILLHHPRSFLDIEGVRCLQELDSKIMWGGFTHIFDQKEHLILKINSWYSNNVRFDKRGIVYLDHCIFFRKILLDDDPIPVPELDIFEDTAFSLKLRKKAFPHRLPYLSTTSAYRFQKNGIICQLLLNQILKIGYYFNVSTKSMNLIYEKALNLNSSTGNIERDKKSG